MGHARGRGEDCNAAIRHLDQTFNLTREGDYAGLFVDLMLHDKLEPLTATRAEIVAGARATLDGDEPEREMGAHCDVPFACSFKGYCAQLLPAPPLWPISLLPDTKGKRVARK